MCYLLAIGGHTGTGKTTLAYSISKTVPIFSSAVILDDDHIRRELLDADLAVKLKPEDYSPEITRQVRHITEKRTAEAINEGLQVINPTGFFYEPQRAMIIEWAKTYSAKFIGLWLVAPRLIMEQRITKRLYERDNASKLMLEDGHASDADIGVIDKFGDLRTPQGKEWHVIDTDVPKSTVLERAQEIIESYIHNRM